MPWQQQGGIGLGDGKRVSASETITAGVKAFASGPHSMVLVVKATQPIPQTLVIRASANGSKLTIPVPTPSVAGVNVVLTALHLSVPARGSARSALITAGRCTAKSFTVTSHFSYSDGTTLDVPSSSPCH